MRWICSTQRNLIASASYRVIVTLRVWHREFERRVTITRYDAEAIKFLCVEQIHRINDQRAIRGVFSDGISKLLNRLDRLFQKNVLPPPQIRSSPIAIDAPDTCNAVLSNFR